MPRKSVKKFEKISKDLDDAIAKLQKLKELVSKELEKDDDGTDAEGSKPVAPKRPATAWARWVKEAPSLYPTDYEAFDKKQQGFTIKFATHCKNTYPDAYEKYKKSLATSAGGDSSAESGTEAEEKPKKVTKKEVKDEEPVKKEVKAKAGAGGDSSAESEAEEKSKKVTKKEVKAKDEEPVKKEVKAKAGAGGETEEKPKATKIAPKKVVKKKVESDDE